MVLKLTDVYRSRSARSQMKESIESVSRILGALGKVTIPAQLFMPANQSSGGGVSGNRPKKL
jgi:hypothetical protein